MESAIERLKASKAQFKMLEADEGKKHGREWAELEAEFAELLGLSKVHPGHFPGDDPMQAERLLNEVWRAVDPDGLMEFSEWRADVFDTAHLSTPYVRAWIEGAKEFFEEIKHQLD